MASTNEPVLGRPTTSESEVVENIRIQTSTSSMLQSTPENEQNSMSRSQAYNLYTSHFLSTWNVRTYEFAAIIFTASAYPDTLIAAAVRGIVRTLASICFSSMVGRWVDQNPNRLQTLLSTISANRFTVISASILWFFIVTPNTSSPSLTPSNAETTGNPTHYLLKGGVFTLILLFGILEALSASGNMLSMERDWVITAASPAGQAYDLTHLNSVMRRIDLICKLIAPILISIIVSATSTRIGVLVVGAMSAASWAVEIFCARRVWNRNPRLQELKASAGGDEVGTQVLSPVGVVNRFFQGLRHYAQDFKTYFSSTVCIPSLALALLHLSALSYSATFITFLLSTGFSLQLITVARAAGSVVEISSTVVTPVGVQYLGKAGNHGRFRGRDILGDGETLLGLDGVEDREGRTETGLERLGLWGISWQLLNLIPVVYALWSLSPTSPAASEPGPGTTLPKILTAIIPHPSRPLLAFTLFTFLSLSRLGLWIYDLTTQQLTQTLTSPSTRSSFTGVEYSFVSLFELAQNIMAIILSRPGDFKWIALVSLLAVGLSTGMYAAWVARMRGHLVHWERLGKG
ncbi:hypothetical protein IFR05_012302, partial [Cadophora sp. M221]